MKTKIKKKTTSGTSGTHDLFIKIILSALQNLVRLSL